MNEHFSSRIDAVKWTELMDDVLKIIIVLNEARDVTSSSGVFRFLGNLKSKVTNGASLTKHAKNLPGKILNKWINILDDKNISVFLFYFPEFGDGRKMNTVKDVTPYGFVLQMHFGLADIQNFRPQDPNKAVDLESKIKEFKKTFKKKTSSAAAAEETGSSAVVEPSTKFKATNTEDGNKIQGNISPTPTTAVTAFGDCVCF